MQKFQTVRWPTVLALALLTLCAASPDSAASNAPASPSVRRVARFVATGAFGAFLEGRFGAAEGDLDGAAEAFLRALGADPRNPDLVRPAFAACLLAGRAEAVRLARQLPDAQEAQLLLAGQEMKIGNWGGAEQRIRSLPRQGLAQVLQPMLLAWTQFGAGRVDAALATLRPLVEGQRLRGVYALHAAMINDLAGRNAEAARLYLLVQSDAAGANLRLAQIIASWQARQGHLAEARQTLRALGEMGNDLPVAIPAMLSAASQRPVARASDGIAEVYLAFAGELSQQDSGQYAQVLLRLALDLRPDLTAARLLMADVLDAGKHSAAALQLLASVTAEDTLSGIVRLRRAGLAAKLEHTEEGLRDLDQLARDYPDTSLPYALQADILRQKSRYTEAVAAYDRAIARIVAPKRNTWSLFYARGVAHDRAHDWPHAESDLQRAMELAPDQPYVLNYLGYSWADQGNNLPRARELIERALELKPDDGAIIDSLGWVVFRQGDVQGAIKLLERAVELQSTDVTINSHLGDVYWSAGRKREAQFQWRRALTLNPEPEDKVKLEAKLQDNVFTETPAAAERSVQ